jgi:hypothetical protein
MIRSAHPHEALQALRLPALPASEAGLRGRRGLLRPRDAGAQPLVLGIPLSLFYVVCWVAASFVVLLALFHWEGRQEGADEDDGGRGR